MEKLQDNNYQDYRLPLAVTLVDFIKGGSDSINRNDDAEFRATIINHCKSAAMVGRDILDPFEVTTSVQQGDRSISSNSESISHVIDFKYLGYKMASAASDLKRYVALFHTLPGWPWFSSIIVVNPECYHKIWKSKSMFSLSFRYCFMLNIKRKEHISWTHPSSPRGRACQYSKYVQYSLLKYSSIPSHGNRCMSVIWRRHDTSKPDSQACWRCNGHHKVS